MVHVSWRKNTKQNKYNTPKKSGIMAIKKQVLDSFRCAKKQQALLPFQFLLARLSFVSTTPFLRTKEKS
jgi:hypothetical protein